ncbi:uncharacterized protein BXZ73DRAFT_108730 [Epithele typhae]|uniref:uncharacterized protein n=1 Tax=Epithele typhae TaxID=378194 RepID=UPI0020083308|nr:uncharacterized protein BXZ73DRAFT_108730 [Epithele typhae]KAH9910642.1 hypothetical protein BXZ73DRAFT_108730 [Epithele typhae]
MCSWGSRRPIHNLGFWFGPNKGQQALFNTVGVVLRCEMWGTSIYKFNAGRKEAKAIQLMLIGDMACSRYGRFFLNAFNINKGAIPTRYNQFWNDATESTQIIMSFWAHTYLVSPTVSQPSTFRGNTNNLPLAISYMGITGTQNVRSTAQMIRTFYNNSDDYPIFDASQHFKVNNPTPGFRVKELSNLPIYSGPKPHSNELRLYDLALVCFTVNTYGWSDVDFGISVNLASAVKLGSHKMHDV